MLLLALTETPGTVLRLVGCVLCLLRMRAASTERARSKVWEDGATMSYGNLFPNHLIVALLGELQ